MHYPGTHIFTTGLSTVLSIICYEIYLSLIITQFCFNLRQHIYDIKKYQSYFGHLPKTNTNNALNNESDIESLPSKQPSQQGKTEQCRMAYLTRHRI